MMHSHSAVYAVFGVKNCIRYAGFGSKIVLGMQALGLAFFSMQALYIPPWKAPSCYHQINFDKWRKMCTILVISRYRSTLPSIIFVEPFIYVPIYVPIILETFLYVPIN